MKVQIVNKSAYPTPAYATEKSAGMDLKANITEPITLGPLERALVPTGLFIALPDGTEAQVRPRSGLAAKFGISVLNSPGTIDADYRGEVKVILVNLSNDSFVINPGERIAQMVVARYEKVEWDEVEVLDETERGEGEEQMKFIIACIVISGAAIGALIKEVGRYCEEINPAKRVGAEE